jgi:hypothetical protein
MTRRKHYFCEYCGKMLERKLRSNGYLETVKSFKGRNHCDGICSRRGRGLKKEA